MPRTPAFGEVPYTEIAPPPDLAPYVDRLWLRTTLVGGDVVRVLPDGCVDLIVDARHGAAELVGTMTRAALVATGPAQLVAVRFRPGTATALTGCALADLTDRSADAPDLGLACGAVADLVGAICDPTAATRCGASHADDAGRSAREPADLRRAAPLSARIPLATADHARVAALVAWLRARLADAAPPDALVARAVALLSTGAGRVDDVAERLRVTRQHLARSFRRDVGISPKQLARIARMQRAAVALRRGGDLARLAAELGYFDQSHLTHDLRDLAGLTPTAVAAERPIALSHLFH